MTSENSKEYRDMINNLDVGFYKGEFKGKLLMHNQKFNEIFGIDPSKSLAGSKATQFFIDTETQEKYYETLIENGFIRDFIAQIKRPDGDKIVVQLNSHLIRNSKGEPIEIEGTIINITDKFRLEQKLKKEEQEKSIILENILEHFVFQSLDHTVKYLNKAACDSVGKVSAQLIGHKCYEIWHNRDKVCENCPVELSFKTKKPEINEIETPDGRIWIVKGYPIFDEKGKLISAVEVTTEITEQRRMERKLKQSEQKYRFLVEQSLQGICILHDVRIIFANKALSEILGYSIEEILSLSREEVEKLIHPDDRELVLNRHLDRLKGMSVPPHYEFRIIRKDGKVKTVDMYARLIKLNNKSYIQEVFVDITERKKAEKELDFLSSITRQVKDSIIVTNTEFKITYINKATEELYGYSPDELIGKSPDILNAEPMANQIQEEIYQTILSKNVWIGSHLNMKKNRTTFICELKVSPLIDRNGQIYASIGIMRDITKRKNAELALRESEEKYRTTLNSIGDAIHVIDIDKKIILINPAVEHWMKLLNIDIDIIGRPFIEAFPFLENNILEEYQQVFETGEPLITLERNIVKGREYITETRKIPIFHKAKVSQIITIIRDITERKIAEQKLKESEEKYREAYNRANFYKDLFAHDINNILQNIISASELSSIYINNGNQQEKLHEAIDIVKEQVKKGAGLISKVRKLSEIEETQVTLEPTNICEVLKNSIDFSKKSFQSRDINIVIDSFSDNIYIKANSLLSDLVENIIINSITHNRSPQIEINIKISKIQQDGKDYIKMEFGDNGVGVPDDQKKFIFKKKTDGYESGRGMGLGLSLVKKIIDSYNGQIWVEDRVKGNYSKGCKFILLIPEAE